MNDHSPDDEFPLEVDSVAYATYCEEVAQNEKWGEQNHPNGTGNPSQRFTAMAIRTRTQKAFAEGEGTWRHVLEEEVAEAFAESDPDKLKAELIQVAAVAQQWVRAIDRRIEAEKIPSMEEIEGPPEEDFWDDRTTPMRNG